MRGDARIRVGRGPEALDAGAGVFAVVDGGGGFVDDEGLTRADGAMSARDWSLLWALSLLWGMSFMFVEVALESVAPMTLVTIRVGGAAILLGVALRLRGVRLAPALSRWRVYVWMGFLGNAFPFGCFAWGQQFVDSGMAGVLNSTTPLFTAVFAALVGLEKMRAARIFGALLGAGGVAVMLSPSDSAGDAAAAGALACVAAAASYGVVAILGKKKSRRVSADGKRLRAVDIRDAVAAAVVAGIGESVGDADWRGGGMEFGGAGVFQHGLRVYFVFSPAGERGSDERDAGDFSDSD